MVSVEVSRGPNGTRPLLTSRDTFYYDETVQVAVKPSSEGEEVHVTAAVVGRLAQLKDDLRVTIFEATLDQMQPWSFPLHIRHPRSPLQDPQLEITATVVKQASPPAESSSSSGTSEASDETLLTSFEPVPIHTVRNDDGESFKIPEWITASIPRQVPPRPPSPPAIAGLSLRPKLKREYSHTSTASQSSRASRKSNSTTHTGVSDNSKSSVPSIPVAAVDFRFQASLRQALDIGMRCVRPVLDKDWVIAEIDMDSEFRVRVEKCQLTIDEGTCEPMGDMTFPFELDAKGSYCFSYSLHSLAASHNLRRTLSIAVEYTILDVGEPEPTISTLWTPVIDFEDTQGPLPKTPMLAIPSSPPGNPGNGPAMTMSVMGSSKGSNTSVGQFGTNTATRVQPALNGVSLVLTGPNMVKHGAHFEWSVKAVNRSPRARKLALRFTSAEVFDNPAISSTSSAENRSLFVDCETLRNLDKAYRLSTGSDRGIIPLCHELRLGVIAPNSCYETRMSLLALRPGTHRVESAAIVDLATGDFYDIGELLEVIVE